MKTILFDLETGPLPDDMLASVKPTFTAPSNYKDGEKIKANIAEQEAAWKERAALSAETGEILAAGVMKEDQSFTIYGDGEKNIVEDLLTRFKETLHESGKIIGFNIFGFDLPFLYRRAWILGVKPPEILRKGRYWHDGFIDLMEKWSCGNREQRISLDSLAKSLHVGAKNGDGKDFAKLWATDRKMAITYLENDLILTKLCAERMLP